jgi:hypothetical protein
VRRLSIVPFCSKIPFIIFLVHECRCFAGGVGWCIVLVYLCGGVGIFSCLLLSNSWLRLWFVEVVLEECRFWEGEVGMFSFFYIFYLFIAFLQSTQYT